MATKTYGDKRKAGKEPCIVAVTSNVDLTAPGATLDGVNMATASNTRVLLTGQTAGAEDGIYNWVSATSLVRADDADTTEKVQSGFVAPIIGGTYAASLWVAGECAALGTTDFDIIQAAQDPTPILTYADYTPGAAPAALEGRVSYDSEYHTLIVHSSGGSTLQVGQEMWVRVYNDSGADIDDGDAVYISGAANDLPEVALADASIALTATAVVGIATQDIADASQGMMTISGVVHGLDTTGPGAETWGAGDPVYASAATPGLLTNVIPASPHSQVRVGFVTKVDAVDGHILVAPMEGPANTGVHLYSGGGVTKHATIVAALAAAASGDVVLVGQGVYAENPAIPTNVTVRGALGDGQAYITGAAATGVRVTLSNLSRLENVKVLLPTDALPAISHALAAPGVTFVNTVELVGAGASGIGIQHSGQGNCIVHGMVYRAGACGAVLHTTAACTGKLEAWDVQLGGGTVADAVLVEEGQVVINRLSAPSNVTVTDGISVDAGSFHGFAILFGSGTTNGLHVTGDGTDVEIDGFHVESATTPLLADPGVTTGALRVLNGVGKANDVDAGVDYLSQSTTIVVFMDDTVGDEGLNIWGELHVGSPWAPRESVFGGGDSHTVGMHVFTNTNGTAGDWADVTAAAKSGLDSTVTAFPGVAAENCMYVGGDLEFPGVKLSDISTAMTLGAGAVILEYWNGAAWVEVQHMAADADPDYGAHGNTIFERGASTNEQIRFGAMPTWTALELNSETKFWVRLRITTGITTSPVFQQCKVHTDRFEANPDGFTEWFGAARPPLSYPFNIANMIPVTGITAASEDLNYSATIVLAARNNRFTNNLVDGTGGKVTILEGTDTSYPLSFAFDLVPLSTGGDYEMNFIYTVLSPTDPLDGTSAEVSDPTVKTAGATDVPQTFVWEVPVATLVPGDSIAFALVRDATGLGPPDTLAGNVALETVGITGVRWK